MKAMNRKLTNQIDTNPTVPIITLNMNSLNYQLKDRNYESGLKK